MLNTQLERRLSEYDVAHVFGALAVWELPVGRGEGNRRPDESLAGWIHQITERVKFQLRGDAQNAYNYPWFSRIGSVNVTAGNSGILNPSPNSESREIILAAKLLF